MGFAMKITFAGETALQVLRAIRCGLLDDACMWPKMGKRVNLIDPDSSPQIRWSKKLLSLSRFGLKDRVGEGRPIDVAASSKSKRIRAPYVRNAVFDEAHMVPPKSFVRVADDIAISSPELLFVEMGETMKPAEHLMFGMELCGRFSRHPDDWRNGRAKMDIAPVTSVARIEEFTASAKWLRGITQARKTVRLLAENAWSPTEAIVAAMAVLPLGEFGYGLGRCEMNVRVKPDNEAIARTMTKESRVPDIVFNGSTVGINYDGVVHLDLGGIAQAGIEVGLHPEVRATQTALDKIVRDVRAKAVDDIRRNRELMANGYTVFPVVKEDLYDEGGLDKVMLQVIGALERTTDADLSSQREALDLPFATRQRQRLIWSLLPGSREKRISSDLGLRYSDDPATVREMLIGF